MEKGDRLPLGFGLDVRGASRRIFFFMRTADCPVCRGHVRRLAAIAPSLAELDASVVVFAPDAAPPSWASGLPFPFVAGPTAFEMVGFGRTLGAIQQSGVLIADAHGVVLYVRRVTLPPFALSERELFDVLKSFVPAPA